MIGYVAAIYLGWLLMAYALGAVITTVVQGTQPDWTGRQGAPGWLFLLGLAVLYVAGLVPILGGLLAFVGLCLGLGALLVVLYRTMQRRREVEAEFLPAGGAPPIRAAVGPLAPQP